MILRTLALFLALCNLGYAADTSTSPTPQATTKQHSGAHNKGTHQSVGSPKNVPTKSIVEISPSSVLQVGSSEREEARHGFTSAEWWVVYVTAVLALITLGLALYTAKLYRATVELGRDAKSSSKNQANALQAIERAYLFADLEIVNSNIPDHNGWQGDIELRVWNYGKTPAEIVQIRFYTTVEPTPPQTLFEYPGSDRPLPPGLGIAQNKSFEGVVIPFHLHANDVTALNHGNIKMYCVGRIRYKDIFDSEHETGFCWFYHTDVDKFGISPNSNLNRRT